MSSYDPLEYPKRQVELLRRWARGRGSLLVVAILVVVGMMVVSTSYYQIEPDEVGVVLRFGKHMPPNSPPGLHFKLPFGIDEVYKVPVERQLKMEFGFRTVRAGIQSQFVQDSQGKDEAKMLTAFRNVAIVEWIVQYKIANAEKYLFNFRDIDTTLRLMAEATMRSVVGDYTLDELITGGREEVEREARKLLEELNERYDTGIVIQQLKLQDANVPDKVKPALREVEEAKQTREKAINLAKAEKNKIIPKAKGVAKESVAKAEGYRTARVNMALGDAYRFKKIHAEYAKAKEVTRTRLYLEALTRILPKAKNKVVVDKDTKSLVPLLNLNGGGR